MTMTVLNVDTDDEGRFLEDAERVSLTIDDEGVMHHYRCSLCGESCFDGEQDERGTCEDGEPHGWERIPLSWCNHAAITLDEDDDAVHVSISVGDPRGAFVFTIRRLPDKMFNGDVGEHSGRLIMHVPYPGASTQHAELTPVHEGTYLVGH